MSYRFEGNTPLHSQDENKLSTSKNENVENEKHKRLQEFESRIPKRKTDRKKAQENQKKYYSQKVIVDKSTLAEIDKVYQLNKKLKQEIAEIKFNKERNKEQKSDAEFKADDENNRSNASPLDVELEKARHISKERELQLALETANATIESVRKEALAESNARIEAARVEAQLYAQEQIARAERERSAEKQNAEELLIQERQRQEEHHREEVRQWEIERQRQEELRRNEELQRQQQERLALQAQQANIINNPDPVAISFSINGYG